LADLEQNARAQINAETAKIGWHELQRFFAQGTAISVDPQLDLVEVAWQIAQDNKDQLERWLDAGVVAPVSDQQAAKWLAADAVVWTVVVRPWVLVQLK